MERRAFSKNLIEFKTTAVADYVFSSKYVYTYIYIHTLKVN